MANVKLGNNTLTGVSTVKLQSADTAGEYVSFGLGGAPADLWSSLGRIAASSSYSNASIGGRLVYRPL